MNEYEAASIIKQVVSGLLYLHSHHILHRDMSLSNLLLTKDMSAKIADFGLATQLARPDEKHMTMCGTPNYISPEVASRASHGLPADVWGLGCMLYTLLVGKPPFDTDGIRSTLTKVVMAEYQIPSSLSLEAIDLINKLLRKNPAERITLEDVLKHPFMNKMCQVTSYHKNGVMSLADSGILTLTSEEISQNTNSYSTRTPRSMDMFQTPQKSVASLHEAAQQVSSILSNNEINYAGTNKRCLNEPMPVNDYQIMRSYESDNLLQFTSTPRENYLTTGPKMTRSTSTEVLGNNNYKLNSYKKPHHFSETNIGPTKSDIVQQQTERITVPPIKTSRLLPTRHKTKNAIFNILESGEVVIEFLKHKTKTKEDRVVDVCRISMDGARIIIYQPDAGR